MNISQIVGIHRNLVAPSQSVQYGNATTVGNQQPRIVFRIQKIGSHLAGKLSEIRFSLAAEAADQEGTFLGGIVAQSLLNCVNQLNVYIGQTKVLGYNDSFLYLNTKERMENHPSLFHNTCAYYVGFNEKERTHIVPNADGNGFTGGFINYRDDTNPFFRILDPNALGVLGLSENNSFDFVLPLPMISDAFLQDIPLHLLDKQDITIEIFLDLRNSFQFLRSLDPLAEITQGGGRLLKAELYQVSYTEPPQVLAKQRELSIPFTNVREVISNDGDGIRNFQFSVAREKLKKMIIHSTRTDGASPYLGRTWSDFRDSQGEMPTIQVRYNDKLYFPENVPVDTRIFSYKNDCSLFGQYVQPLGTHSVEDRLLLSSQIVPYGCFNDLQSLIWGGFEIVGYPLNNVVLPFSFVEFNSVLANNLELIGENINDKPMLITITPRGTGTFTENTLKLYVHLETQRIMMIKPNDVMIMNA